MTPAPRTPLRAQLLTWMLLGVAVSLFLQWTQARALGGWSEMVPVGVAAPLRPVIESELGPLSDAWSQSHDGQYSFAVALDPYAETGLHDLFDSDGYRYRRILYPLLAGGFGSFRGNTLLLGLVLVAAAGFGLATAATFDLSVSLGARRWVLVAVLVNPGLWLSVRMFTVDALAIGLGLAGVAVWLRGHTLSSLVLLSAAVLTKEQYVLIPAALAGWSWFEGYRAKAVAALATPALPVIGWAAFLSTRMPEAFAPRGNLTFLGFLDSWRIWRSTSSLDQALIAVSVIGIVGASALLIRSASLLRWLILPWILLAGVSSSWVWDLGNNAARVFAPIWVFGLIALDLFVRRPHEQSSPAPLA